MTINPNVVAPNECISCHRPLPPGLFCPYCGVFVPDPQARGDSQPALCPGRGSSMDDTDLSPSVSGGSSGGS
jgi:hypothetical protein